MVVTPSVVRTIASITAGLVAGGVMSAVAPWQLSVLVAWIVAAAVFVLWVWSALARFDGDATRRHATMEDSARTVTGLVVVSAAVVSLAGVGVGLLKANNGAGAGKAVLIVAAVATVAVSWALVHTVFTLRYAHEYYSDTPGGIDFKSGDDYEPDYRDFAYLGFTVGMTFQVSDTDVQSRTIRRTVLSHALLAYLFGAVILAVTVNVVASLLA